ncbi:MAG: hypothetical protein AAGU02_00850 [Lawsonibacter sp.]
MISNTSATLFILVLVVIALFTIWSIYNRKRLTLLHKLYLFLVLDYSIWNITMLGMWLTPPGRTDILQLLDSFTYLGIAVPSIYLMIAIVFASNYERFRPWMLVLLIIPVLSFSVCLTATRVFWPAFICWSALPSAIEADFISCSAPC